jgi:hypothetical protein
MLKADCSQPFPSLARQWITLAFSNVTEPPQMLRCTTTIPEIQKRAALLIALPTLTQM